MYPPEKPLTETAHDRLMTIASHTDLGAGIQVAMKDLEIRGAGNLLGGEQSATSRQSGSTSTYAWSARRSRTSRGGARPRLQEIKIELPVDAHLPHDYVPGERLRLEAYKKLAAVIDEQELTEIEAELRDRYGPPPEPVRNLLEVARLRTVRPLGRDRRHRRPRTHPCGSARSTCGRASSCGCSGSTPGSIVKDALGHRSWSRSR